MQKVRALTGEGGSSAKRAKTFDATEFTLATDLTIVIEDQRVEVHSLILMMVSPVFRQMLSVDMGERATREVVLAGKKKSEFDVLWKIVQPLGREVVVPEAAHLRLRTANFRDPGVQPGRSANRKPSYTPVNPTRCTTSTKKTK